jgi:serine/threonine protein kinase
MASSPSPSPSPSPPPLAAHTGCTAYLYEEMDFGAVRLSAPLTVLAVLHIGVFAAVAALLAVCRRRARSGSHAASRALVLPVYARLLGFGVAYALLRFALLLALGWSALPPVAAALTTAALLATRHAIVDGTTVFLAREYYGADAIRIGVRFTAAWGAVVFAAWCAVALGVGGLSAAESLASHPRSAFSIVASAIVLAAVAAIVLGPRVSARWRAALRRCGIRPRPAFLILAAYDIAVYSTLAIRGAIGLSGTAADCGAFFLIDNVLVALFPAVMYWALWRDSLFLCLLDTPGAAIAAAQAAALSDTEGRYTLLDEEAMHSYVVRTASAPLLDYRLLFFRHELREGSTSTVFHGKYDSRDVAIKEIMCPDLARDEVVKCCREAAFMARLHHRNVIEFLGVCAMPPHIYLVSRFYANGDLYAYLRTKGPFTLPRILRMALDAASGVAYLHTRSPPIVWRDCKTANFLVDTGGTVVVCDFGESRFLESAPASGATAAAMVFPSSPGGSAAKPGQEAPRWWQRVAITFGLPGPRKASQTVPSGVDASALLGAIASADDVFAVDEDASGMLRASPDRGSGEPSNFGSGASGLPSSASAANMSYNSYIPGLNTTIVSSHSMRQHLLTTGIGTPGYAAPEVILCRSDYTLAVDIFSLGIVLWEIFTADDPFPDLPAEEVLSQVLAGERPPIPDACPVAYARLIRECWDEVPERRPTALRVVKVLEGMQGAEDGD